MVYSFSESDGIHDWNINQQREPTEKIWNCQRNYIGERRKLGENRRVKNIQKKFEKKNWRVGGEMVAGENRLKNCLTQNRLLQWSRVLWSENLRVSQSASECVSWKKRSFFKSRGTRWPCFLGIDTIDPEEVGPPGVRGFSKWKKLGFESSSMIVCRCFRQGWSTKQSGKEESFWGMWAVAFDPRYRRR